MFDGDSTIPDDKHHLTWANVAIGSLLLLANAILSLYLGLGLEATLFMSSVRCVVQLSLLGLTLKPVFENDGPLLVSVLALSMMTISAIEIVFNKSKLRFVYMLPTVWISMVVSTGITSFIGNFFAIQASPWYSARDYITILGMLLGNSMSGVAVGLSSTLTQISEHKERIEFYLAHGASRWEAAKPIGVEAIRLALLPTLNSMSVMGLISIPGMMTGQILGGASIDDAVRYQLIVMFMITASCTLATIKTG
ncbi:hypothetical protein HDU97_000302 [Phlyctochytrium planicorne]|nr:hypothetical protein HDU97_000302 [Phlyctochytrium planicorne]